MAEPVKSDGVATNNSSAPAETPKAVGVAASAGVNTGSTSASANVKPPKPPNPVFRMMGLPNLPKKLPSRNWMIFWGVLLSFTAAKTYDSQQKKAVQRKWCDLVAHVSQQRMDVRELPRKLTVFLSASPGDGIGPSRQYFKDYVKPILVAAAMDYDVIEGRKEGDVRYGTAEQIRRLRRKKGEHATEEQEMDTAMTIDLMRERLQLLPEPGVRGDLVLGRHTWKEYIRGIHEGWLGPLDAPPEPIPESDAVLVPESSPMHPPTEAMTQDPAITTSSDTALDILADQTQPDDEKKEQSKEGEKTEEKKEEKKKTYPPPSFLPIQQYSSAPLSPHTPTLLEPSQPIHQQHLLGFLKTPQRIYNWLNRRSLQDQVGRQTAAIVLAHYRPYTCDESFVTPSSDANEPSIATKAPESDLFSSPVQTSASYEQQSLLVEEEPYWHKSVRQPLKDLTKEQILVKDIVLDPRIAQRMQKFELDIEQEERANKIAAGDASAKWAVPVQDLTQSKPIISADEDSMT